MPVCRSRRASTGSTPSFVGSLVGNPCWTDHRAMFLASAPRVQRFAPESGPREGVPSVVRASPHRRRAVCAALSDRTGRGQLPGLGPGQQRPAGHRPGPADSGPDHEGEPAVSNVHRSISHVMSCSSVLATAGYSPSGTRRGPGTPPGCLLWSADVLSTVSSSTKAPHENSPGKSASTSPRTACGSAGCPTSTPRTVST